MDARAAGPHLLGYNPTAMDADALRILDANLNRSREAMRVLEEHVRLVRQDAALCQKLKQMRHRLAKIAEGFGAGAMLSARDIRGDVGTDLSTETERQRTGPAHVARAAAKRLTESLRCIEEYGKIVNSTAAMQVRQLRYDAYALEQDILTGLPRRNALWRARLHVLITEALCKGRWQDVCEQALEGGADVLQLREKTLSDRTLLDRARQLRTMTRRFEALLVINDRPDIARLADADGVHLGRHDLPISQARRIIGANGLVGATVHSVAEADAALAEEPDYLGVGPMFASQTKPPPTTSRMSDEPAGPALLVELQEAAVPLVAIGGITVENISMFLTPLPEARNLQVAVCQAVVAADAPATAAADLKKKLIAAEAESDSRFPHML